MRIVLLFFFLLSFSPFTAFSQNCSLKISGYVKDSGTGLPLDFVNILLQEINSGVSTDSTGYFELSNLCHGDYHLILSHIGCESQQIFLHIHSDTTLTLLMEHSINELNGIVVTGAANPTTSQSTETLNQQEIADNSNENLSNLLESFVGVSAIKNGSGISKPVVHGLYGNRLTILNNGISQSGQQWGNDHSPEIDPLVANKIRVIKGTSALEYMGASMGSVVLVEPSKIGREPHLHSKASYFFESNGRGNGLNVQMQRYHPQLSWRINGTLKKSGDKKAPNYFLNNTGHQEANLALQLEKVFFKKWNSDLYFSTFNTYLGVLRGSHISNPNNLKEAFQRDVPFNTEEQFSYTIEAPKQSVNHHLLKLHTKYFFTESNWLDLTFANQINKRREFDIRRGGRTDIPALSLLQYTYSFGVKYEKESKNNGRIKLGIQSDIVDNTNNPETEILPLIPDYFSYQTGIYFLATQQKNKSFFELGLRYDFSLQNVAAISNTTPREILRFNNQFHNVSGSGGWSYTFNEKFQLAYNLGLSMRNPAINELYSNGLHQGVSGIEEGNPNLRTEQGIKSTIELKGKLNHAFSFESLLYYQHIKDYIFLNPQDEIRPTIRGSFPVFKYEQTDAQIFGLDLSGKYQFNNSLHAKVNYSFIRGNDLTKQLPLIYIPSNKIGATITYEFLQAIPIGKKQLENLAIELNSQYVFQQQHLLPEQDFVIAPEAYYLLGAKLASDLQVGKTRFRFTAKVDNLLNVAYRDYLNRQRYFADDLGINATFGISLKF